MSEKAWNGSGAGSAAAGGWPAPLARVPFGALAARPHGIAVAARAVDLADAVATALSADEADDFDDAVGDGDGDAVPGAVEAERNLVDAIACWERDRSRAEARQLRAMAALAGTPMFAGCQEHGPDDPQHGARSAASVVSAELGISPGQARNRVELACELVGKLPSVVDAMAEGRIDSFKARILAEETRPLADNPGLRAGIVADLLVKADRRSGPQLRAAARKAVLSADPASAQERHERARRGRGVCPPCPEPDGMASMWLRLPAEDAIAFFTAVDAAARAVKTNYPDDKRSLEQVRADILAELAWSALRNGHLGCCNPDCGHVSHRMGERRGRPAHVGVTVPISTLLGLNDAPGDLHGYGPITGEVARKLAADGVWRRLLTDPVSGALLDYGKTRYTPPQDLAEHVVARDRTCVFPTCSWPADACDLDHTVPAAAGGPTADHNLGPVHRWHHIDRTHHGWRLEQPESGRYIWIAPTGHWYEVDPEIIGPILGDPEPPDPQPPPEADPDPPPF